MHVRAFQRGKQAELSCLLPDFLRFSLVFSSERPLRNGSQTIFNSGRCCFSAQTIRSRAGCLLQKVGSSLLHDASIRFTSVRIVAKDKAQAPIIAPQKNNDPDQQHPATPKREKNIPFFCAVY